MSSSQKFKSTFRSLVGQPLVFFVYAYAASLTLSMAGMEIASWAAALFCIFYVLVDRTNPRKQVELHTLGVELPLLAFVVVGILGLRLNAPDSDFVTAIGSLRNLFLIFVFTYSLQAVRNLNRIFALIMILASVVAVYAIWQHFTGIDLWRNTQETLSEMPFASGSGYAATGLFSHHLTYGHSFMMLLCFPWAALLLARRVPWWLIVANIASFCLILTSLIFSYGRGVWVAVLVALPVMAFFASKKLFAATLAILLLGGGILMKTDPLFKERAMTAFTENYSSNEDRKKLWDINIEMFHDHPWIGVGYKQNEALSEQYYKKLGITEGTNGHASSNYVELLSTTGFLGFAAYMLFILSFILMTARLFSTIPTTHYWHRVFTLAALGAQIAFHVGGLTQWNWGDAEVQHQFLFWLAVISYMSHQYYAHIVPDDHSL